MRPVTKEVKKIVMVKKIVKRPVERMVKEMRKVKKTEMRE